MLHAGKVDYPHEWWITINPLAKALTQSLLARDPEKRISARAALAHQWFETSKKLQGPLRASVFDGILEFHDYNKIKQAVLRLIANELEEKTIGELRNQFLLMNHK